MEYFEQHVYDSEYFDINFTTTNIFGTKYAIF